MLSKLSAKQRRVVCWWAGSRGRTMDGVICEGAVRSGKTAAAGLGFVLWAMCRFDRREFAICGKSREAVRRNLVLPLSEELRELGFDVVEKVSDGVLVVRCGEVANVFRLFGGMNEASAALVQGITLAGVLFDEVTLMPQSFVSQCMARCSVDGAKVWFCLNPDSPEHWFKKEFIDRADERRYLRLKFEMSDNPSLTQETIERYYRGLNGKFFRRYVLGLWESGEGLVYDFMGDGSRAVDPPCEPLERYAVSVDYGTANPASFGLWGRKDGVWYRIGEYYHDGRKEGSLTDGEYVDAMGKLVGERRIEAVIVDPSARSFIVALRRAGYRVKPAINDVADGIRVTAAALKEGRIRIGRGCRNAWREFALYAWADGAGDRVVKEHDHAMDEIRYFCMYVDRTGA